MYRSRTLGFKSAPDARYAPLTEEKSGPLPALRWPAIPLGEPNPLLGRQVANPLCCLCCCTSVARWYPRSVQLRGWRMSAYVLGLV
jgi:hypothetical protein